VDFSDPSLAAFETAAALIQGRDASLALLHVIEWPWSEPPAPDVRDLPLAQGAALVEFRRYIETSAAMRLNTLIAAAGLPSPTARLIVNGKPYVEILRVAAQRDADLIVMGVHGRNLVDLTLFGSTTNHVVREATCPVLTLRDSGAATATNEPPSAR
jgi:nucleotide-binding universal stress UspA family protein